MRSRFLSFTLALACAGALSGCDRNIDPYTDDPVEQPDLARIFPEGAQGDERPPIMPPTGAESGGTGAAARGSAPPQARSSSGEALRGTLVLAPELADGVPDGAILFVIARVGPAGPPTAVLRIPNPEFPLEFAIGPEHRMIEQMPFAGPFTLTARVDADGNAMTRNSGDLQGAAEGTHAPGALGLEILIDEVL